MIWGLSLHGWEDVMRVSLIVVGIFGLIAGLSTWFVVKLQRAELANSDQEMAEYKLDTAKEIAVSTARTKEAELKLAELREKLGRPRHLDAEAFSAALKGVPPMPVEFTLVTGDPDSHWVASSIWSALEKAGWPIIQGNSVELFRQTPPLLRMCAGNFGGIAILSKNMSDEESGYLATSSRPQRPNTPLLALWDALWKAIGANEVRLATCPFVPEGQLHIVVAPRWVIFPKEQPVSAAPAEQPK